MKRQILLRTAMHRRGRELMKRWQRLVDHFGDGIPSIAERCYPRLASYRKRAMRLAMKLHSLQHQSP